MLIKKVIALMAVSLVVPYAVAQDSVLIRPEPSQANGSPGQVIVPNPQVNNREVFGKRSQGLDAPESAAIRLLYNHPNLSSWLSQPDRFLLESAKVNSERRVQRNVAFENVCRRALFLNEREFSLNEAASFGKQVDEAEDITNQILVDTYHAMLETLSEEGAELVEKTKASLHKHIGALEYNWEQQTQVDPNIISNYARNCAISQ
jgi:hypothetical protein